MLLLLSVMTTRTGLWLFYANTSAAVKARSDWVVTSSIALEVAEYLMDEDEKILWAPDKYLGGYIQRETGADMVMWDGSCIVHEEFKARGLRDLMNVYPDAAVLVHPESPEAVIDLADVVGSTTQIIRAAQELPNEKFIVATDKGIFHKMRLTAPDKIFIEAPTAGSGATCRSCAHCPWMGMNALDNLEQSLQEGRATKSLLILLLASWLYCRWSGWSDLPKATQFGGVNSLSVSRFPLSSASFLFQVENCA